MDTPQEKTQTPSVIYRSRDLAAAQSLTSFLKQVGVNARLAVEKPHGYFGELPVTDFVHEVMAVDFDTDITKKHVADWERLRREQRLAANEPYCYHCGQSLAALAAMCPKCGESLDNTD